MKNRFLLRSQGADVLPGDAGIRYRTWAPGKRKMEAVILDSRSAKRRYLRLSEEEDGYFSGIDREGKPGDRYFYRFKERDWPDPASRWNPEGVHGPAEIVDPRDYGWQDDAWTPPPMRDLVLYELHIGAFTSEGTFRGAIERLPHIAELGANAIEIMPVADFPGSRNWGYDGVSPYAPAHVYGTPNDLRALVDAAHGSGLAVILDVVYNHLGPDGNYLGSYSRDYFQPTHKTPWGDAFNFELQPVRDFFAENAPYWRTEFHIDGFRLDATHAIIDRSDRHLLAEVSDRIHSLGGIVMAEDERNEVRLVQSTAIGGMGLDGCWADDFHHIIRVMQTGEREGYYAAYGGTTEELVETLRDGWLFHGPDRKRVERGETPEAREIPPERFIFCISNHDQIGNRPFGRRLSEFISPEAYRAVSALLCLAPYTPLLFMGQEWATSSPFQYFTDHESHLGRQITNGRREEFRGFSAFLDPAERAKIPDPQAVETFHRSKVDWDQVNEDGHAETFELYRECLRLRRELPALRHRERGQWDVNLLEGVITIRFRGSSGKDCAVLVDLLGGHSLPREFKLGWREIFSSNERRFGGQTGPAFHHAELKVLGRV